MGAGKDALCRIIMGAGDGRLRALQLTRCTHSCSRRDRLPITPRRPPPLLLLSSEHSYLTKHLLLLRSQRMLKMPFGGSEYSSMGGRQSDSG